MSTLQRYIFKAALGPLLFFCVVMIGIVWLSQALEFIDLVINRGQSALTFVQLSLYVMPSILKDALPIALFCAALFALHRLRTDSELVVMGAVGIGRWKIAQPILAVSALVMFAAYLLSTTLMPAGYRAMKDRVHEIRGDLVTALVKEGEFAVPMRGLTVFVRELSGSGELRGILVHDNRVADSPVTYTAERGLLVRSDDSAQLIMGSGTIQSWDAGDQNLSLIAFERYTFDLAPFFSANQRSGRELTELYLSELFAPDPGSPEAQRPAAERLAEAHSRLASPLFTLVFAFMALAAITGSGSNRSGYGHRILAVVLAALMLRVAGFYAENQVSEGTLPWPVLYALPATGILLGAMMITNFGWRTAAEKAGPLSQPAE